MKKVLKSYREYRTSGDCGGLSSFGVVCENFGLSWIAPLLVDECEQVGLRGFPVFFSSFCLPAAGERVKVSDLRTYVECVILFRGAGA